MWDIAIGGHISTGETPLITAARELSEELGLNIDDFKVTEIDRVKEQLNNNGLTSNEYVTIYLSYGDVDISRIKLQEEEVSEAKWFSKNELNQLISKKEIIPHVREYEILNSILENF